MSTKDKLVERFKSLPADFTFQELATLLTYLGYTQRDKGKTSGSRVIFKNKDYPPILLHKPHPGNIIKHYALKQVYESLKKYKLL